MDTESLKEIILKQNYFPDSWLYKLFNLPEVFTTAEYATPDETFNYSNGVSIERFVTLHLVVILIISILGAIAIDMKMQQVGNFIILYTIGIFPVLYLVYKNIQFFHNEIIIDNGGMVIERERFEWKDIFQTFIIDESPTGYKGRYQPTAIFLVIVTKNRAISKFEITYLGAPQKTFAGIIEYFKNKSVKNLSSRPIK